MPDQVRDWRNRAVFVRARHQSVNEQAMVCSVATSVHQRIWDLRGRPEISAHHLSSAAMDRMAVHKYTCVRKSESCLMTLTGVSLSVDVSAVTSVLLPIPFAV